MEKIWGEGRTEKRGEGREMEEVRVERRGMRWWKRGEGRRGRKG